MLVQDGSIHLEVDADKTIVFRKRRADVDVHSLAEKVDAMAFQVERVYATCAPAYILGLHSFTAAQNFIQLRTGVKVASVCALTN